MPKEEASEVEADPFSENKPQGERARKEEKASKPNKKAAIRSHEELMKELARKREVAARQSPVSQSPVNRPDIPEAQLAAAWKKLSEKISEGEDVSLHTILKHYTPEFEKGYLIRLKVANKVQSELLNNSRVDLLDFLSAELESNGLELEVVVDSTLEIRDTGEGRHYTVDEKMNLLRERNPDFQVLCEKLGLQPDF